MKLYCVAWKYHSEDQGIPDDFGVFDAVLERIKRLRSISIHV